MPDTKTAEYDVTDRAGKRVAGRVVEKGKPLVLTEAEAEHGLAEGTLVPKGKQLSKAFTEESKPANRMRAEAQAFRGAGAAPEAEPDAEAADVAAPPKAASDPAPSKPAGTA